MSASRSSNSGMRCCGWPLARWLAIAALLPYAFLTIAGEALHNHPVNEEDTCDSPACLIFLAPGTAAPIHAPPALVNGAVKAHHDECAACVWTAAAVGKQSAPVHIAITQVVAPSADRPVSAYPSSHHPATPSRAPPSV